MLISSRSSVLFTKRHSEEGKKGDLGILENMPTRAMDKSVDEIYSGDRRFFVGKKVVFEDVRESGEREGAEDGCCSDESSSIGKNSDLSENSLEKSGDGEEVQSSYKGPLDAMEALEAVLPIRKSISKFYSGKSKSFACLTEASSSSTIAKPDNAYTRRRRNLLSYNLNWDKTRSSPLRGNGGAISKRVTNSSRTTLALAVAMSSSSAESDKQAGECTAVNGALHRKGNPAWRSFSLADLRHCESGVAGEGGSVVTSNES